MLNISEPLRDTNIQWNINRDLHTPYSNDLEWPWVT